MRSVGGRIHTWRHRGYHVDVGAHILTGLAGHNPLLTLVRQLGIGLHAVFEQCPLYDADGTVVPPRLDARVLREFNQMIDATALTVLARRLHPDAASGEFRCEPNVPAPAPRLHGVPDNRDASSLALTDVLEAVLAAALSQAQDQRIERLSRCLELLQQEQRLYAQHEALCEQLSGSGELPYGATQFREGRTQHQLSAQHDALMRDYQAVCAAIEAVVPRDVVAPDALLDVPAAPATGAGAEDETFSCLLSERGTRLLHWHLAGLEYGLGACLQHVR